MSAGFRVRRAVADDRAVIVRVLAEYLPDEDPERRWDWLYAGRAWTWLAVDEASGEIAGLTSFFGRKMVVDGREAQAALGGDGYVRLAYRRRGLGERMHKASRADMASIGVEVMFGTPMPANLTPLTKAGAKTITDTVTFVRPLDARALGVPWPLGRELVRRLSLRRRAARLEPIEPNDPRVDRAWEAARGELGIATIRDAAFYTWRFLRSPSQRQRAFVVVDGPRVLGACAVEELGQRLRLVDLLTPRANLGAVLDAIVAAFPNSVFMDLKLTRESGRALSIERHGFVARGMTKPLNLLLPEGEPRADVYYDPRRWYFTWAESDLDHA